jgi:hypothetical protein
MWYARQGPQRYARLNVNQPNRRAMPSIAC